MTKFVSEDADQFCTIVELIDVYLLAFRTGLIYPLVKLSGDSVADGVVFLYINIEYFNELVGGPDNGYKYLIDSNLDWGQDLRLLKKWIDENKADQIKLAYWGKDNPTYRKINYELLECYKPETGLMAVSVNYLVGFSEKWSECMKWLRESDNKPIDKIAYTIFIYNITEIK